ncbi:MAG: hypothetical protein RAK17_01335, partial [Caldisphaera sp.]|nr:hypothetical protein [Caldisphaera sp.]
IFLFPFPSWYKLVGFISSSTVLTYLMGGVNLYVLRNVAKDLKRPYKMPAVSILAPLGYLAAVMIVYWSGYLTLYYIFTAIFLGIPILLFLYAPYKLGVHKNFAYALGIIEWIIIGILSWFAHAYVISPPSSLSVEAITIYFLIYWILMLATVFGTFYVLSIKIGKEHKQVINASYWLIALIFFTYLVSFFGPFGIYASVGLQAPLPFPIDNIVEIVGALAMFYWSVRVGYRTKELDEIIKG